MTIAHRTVVVNGVELFVAEAGSGPLVLLCHGFPECWYSWRHQIEFLAANGYRCVAPNQRGYADSSAPEAIDAYAIPHLVGDMVALVTALGESQAVIIGHDWGSPVAINAAAWRPDVFRALGMLSVPAAPRAEQPPLESLRALFGDRFFYMLHFQTPGVAEHELQHDVRTSLRRFLFGASGDAPDEGASSLMLNPPPATAFLLDQLAECPQNSAGAFQLPAWLTEVDLDYFTASFERSGFRGPINWYRNIDRSWALAAPYAGQTIDQPSLFISGDRDLIRNNPTWEDNLRAVATDLRGVELLPGIGHWTQQEAPERVNALLLAFLEGL